jgi:tRNA(adenine34) deaminase
MCCGALVHARVKTLIFGTREPRSGAVISAAQTLDNPLLNHRVHWHEGLAEAESAALLRAFFQARRQAAT